MNHISVCEIQLRLKLLCSLCCLASLGLSGQNQLDSSLPIHAWISQVNVEDFPQVSFQLDIEVAKGLSPRINEDLIVVRENDLLCNDIEVRQSADTLPVKYALLLDHSAYQGDYRLTRSHADNRGHSQTLPQLKDALLSFVNSLSAKNGILDRDSVMLLGYGGRVDVSTEMGNQTNTFETILNGLEPVGAATLYDALAEALSTLENYQGRKAIIAFVQGDDEASEKQGDEVILAAIQNQVPIFFVDASSPYRDILPVFAKATGGKLLQVENGVQNNLFFEQWKRQGARFQIAYRSPDTLIWTNEKWIQVKLRNHPSEIFQEFPPVSITLPRYRVQEATVLTQNAAFDFVHWLIYLGLALGAVLIIWWFLAHKP